MPRFVVHEHHGKSLHWDLRLEAGGVLKSWALPKGPTLDPTQRRLAIQTAGHDLAYAWYEGIIPKGVSGAGPVVVWDAGHYEPVKPADPRSTFESGPFTFRLHGDQLNGLFTLIKLRGAGREKAWLLMKRWDMYAQVGWKVMEALTPERKKKLKVLPPMCLAYEDAA